MTRACLLLCVALVGPFADEVQARVLFRSAVLLDDQPALLEATYERARIADSQVVMHYRDSITVDRVLGGGPSESRVRLWRLESDSYYGPFIADTTVRAAAFQVEADRVRVAVAWYGSVDGSAYFRAEVYDFALDAPGEAPLGERHGFARRTQEPLAVLQRPSEGGMKPPELDLLSSRYRVRLSVTLPSGEESFEYDLKSRQWHGSTRTAAIPGEEPVGPPELYWHMGEPMPKGTGPARPYRMHLERSSEATKAKSAKQAEQAETAPPR